MTFQPSAKIIADSVNICGDRLTTFVLTYHRLVHSEFLTHRMISKNSSSSRAIPVEKMIALVESQEVYPLHWGKNQKGMVATQELSEAYQIAARKIWDSAREEAIAYAKELVEIGVHKQVVNRLLEPFSTITVICSATEYQNFFAQRCHCYSDDTEVLTYKGWMPFSKVKHGDIVYSLNPANKQLESAQVIEKIQWESDGTAISLKGATVDLLVSTKHKQVVLNPDESVNFVEAINLVGLRPQLLKNIDFSVTVDKGGFDYKQGFIHGFYLGNGWKYKKEKSGNSGITVCKGGNHGSSIIDKFSDCAQFVYPSLSTTKYIRKGICYANVDGKAIYDDFKDYKNCCEKSIKESSWSKSSDFLVGLFDGLMDADSNICNQSGGLKYYTSSKHLADDVQRLALLIGLSATIACDDRRGSMSKGVDSQGSNYTITTKNLAYRVSINLNRNRPKLKNPVEIVDYQGGFVCVALDKNHTLYVRRKGKSVWSGNCDAQPEIRALADAMKSAYDASEPDLLLAGEWHIPYINLGEKQEWRNGLIDTATLIKIAVGRCARVSYLNHDGKRDIIADISLHDRLLSSKPAHLSPFEHCAMALGESEKRANFVGFEPYRFQLERERQIAREILQPTEQAAKAMKELGL